MKNTPLPLFLLVAFFVLAARAQNTLPLVDPSPDTTRYPFMNPHVFFTSGGFLPPGFGPESDPSAGNEVHLVSIQHTYAASFDLDLQPLLLNRPFFQPLGDEKDADGFDIDAKGAFWSLPINLELARKYGIYLEDFNYFVTRDAWSLAADSSGIESGTYLENFTELWPLNPVANQGRAIFNATDEWKTHLPQPAVSNLQRYKMTCNIGAQMLTGWPNPANIAAVGQPLGAAVLESMVVATNGLGLQLITGPLASYWVSSFAPPASFTITPALANSQIQFTLSPTVVGRRYTLQYATELRPDGSADWRDLPGGSAVATGTSLIHAERLTASSTVFFRVRAD